MTRQAARYRVTAHGDNRAMLIDHETHKDTSYWAPVSGGYVYDVSDRPGTTGRQVCDGLASMGSTLYWSGREPLAAFIRREARKAYRD